MNKQARKENMNKWEQIDITKNEQIIKITGEKEA